MNAQTLLLHCYKDANVIYALANILALNEHKIAKFAKNKHFTIQCPTKFVIWGLLAVLSFRTLLGPFLGFPGALSMTTVFQVSWLNSFPVVSVSFMMKKRILGYICSEYGPEIAVYEPFCNFKTGYFFFFFFSSFFFLSFLYLSLPPSPMLPNGRASIHDKMTGIQPWCPISPPHINPSTEMGHKKPMTTISVAAIFCTLPKLGKLCIL